ncbi:MAG: hypothetical protein ACRES7_01590 [Gammaproteobacteria bacterium]
MKLGVAPTAVAAAYNIDEADDTGLLPAVSEKLINRMAKVAARIQSTVQALVYRPTLHKSNLIRRPLGGHPIKAAIDAATPVMV